MTVHLELVTRDNVVDVCRLRTSEAQRAFVAPAAYSVAQAAYEPGAILRAVVDADRVVGLILAATVAEDCPEPGAPHIWRFLIDEQHQGKGLGRAAVDTFVTEVLDDLGAASITTSYVSADDGPAGFWNAVGFLPTGAWVDGEPVVRRTRP